jgi:hypothetical protein
LLEVVVGVRDEHEVQRVGGKLIAGSPAGCAIAENAIPATNTAKATRHESGHFIALCRVTMELASHARAA